MKDKIINQLVKGGLGKKDAKKKVDQYLDYVHRVYPEASKKEKVNIILSLHN